MPCYLDFRLNQNELSGKRVKCEQVATCRKDLQSLNGLQSVQHVLYMAYVINSRSGQLNKMLASQSRVD